MKSKIRVRKNGLFEAVLTNEEVSLLEEYHLLQAAKLLRAVAAARNNNGDQPPSPGRLIDLRGTVERLVEIERARHEAGRVLRGSRYMLQREPADDEEGEEVLNF